MALTVHEISWIIKGSCLGQLVRELSIMLTEMSVSERCVSWYAALRNMRSTVKITGILSLNGNKIKSTWVVLAVSCVQAVYEKSCR